MMKAQGGDDDSHLSINDMKSEDEPRNKVEAGQASLARLLTGPMANTDPATQINPPTSSPSAVTASVVQLLTDAAAAAAALRGSQQQQQHLAAVAVARATAAAAMCTAKASTPNKTEYQQTSLAANQNVKVSPLHPQALSF